MTGSKGQSQITLTDICFEPKHNIDKKVVTWSINSLNLYKILPFKLKISMHTPDRKSWASLHGLKTLFALENLLQFND